MKEILIFMYVGKHYIMMGKIYPSLQHAHVQRKAYRSKANKNI